MKRTVEIIETCTRDLFSRPLHGLTTRFESALTNEAAGYFRLSAQGLNVKKFAQPGDYEFANQLS